MKEVHAAQESVTAAETWIEASQIAAAAAVKENSLWKIHRTQQQQQEQQHILQQKEGQIRQNTHRMLFQECNDTYTNVTTTNTTTSVVTRNDTFIASVLVAYNGQPIPSPSDANEEEIQSFQNLFSDALISSTPTRDVEEGNCIIESVIVASTDVTVLKTQPIATSYDHGNMDEDLPPQLINPVRRLNHPKQRQLKNRFGSISSTGKRNVVDVEKDVFLVGGGEDDDGHQYYDGLLLVDIVGRCVRSIKIVTNTAEGTDRNTTASGCGDVNEATTDTNFENSDGQNLDADLSRPCQCLIDIGNSIVNGGMAVTLNETIRTNGDNVVTFIETIENILVIEDLDCPVSVSSAASNAIPEQDSPFQHQHRVYDVEVPFIVDDLVLYEPTIKQTIDDAFTITYNGLSSLNIPSSTCFRSFVQKLISNVQLISTSMTTRTHQVSNTTNATATYTTLEFAFDFYCTRYWSNSNSNEACNMLFESNKETGGGSSSSNSLDIVNNNSMQQDYRQLLGLIASITDGINSTTTDGDIETVRRCLCLRQPPENDSSSTMHNSEDMFMEFFTMRLENVLSENGFSIMHLTPITPSPLPNNTSPAPTASQTSQPTMLPSANKSSDLPSMLPTNDDNSR